MTEVAVVGLGKLGSPLAALLASKGYDVVGIDVSEATVQLVNSGRAPVYEPGLQDLISQSGARLRATTDLREAAGADISIILVPTPSSESGAFSNEYVLAATEAIGTALAERSGYHVVVVGSTVMPGSCRSDVLPLLERRSGRRAGDTIGLCYSPEFIALGSVLQDMIAPDMVLIGESDTRAGDTVAQLYRSVVENEPPFRRMSLINAELAKLAVNTYVTMKISYANTLAEICERLDDADSEIVADALGLDTRIGPKYLRGATAYGGPCFPRDNRAFSALARGVGVEPVLADATDAVNRSRVVTLARLAQSHLADGDALGVVGLTYKPGTSVTEESPGMALADVMADAGYDVHAYDPLADDAGVRALHSKVSRSHSLSELVRACDVVVVTTASRELGQLLDDALAASDPPLPVVIDCWGVVTEPPSDDGVTIVRLGRRPAGRREQSVKESL